MRLALFGPPGAGKGTQAAILAETHGLVTISTGNLIRWAIREDSKLGQEAKSYVTAGKLVPGELVRKLADTAIATAGFDNFILDGYPRTLEQAEWLDAFLTAYKAELNAVVFLSVPDEVIIRRLSGRRIHKNTGESYHLEFFPPPPDVDPEDIIQRPDDEPEAIQARLESYRRETKPLEEFYRRKGLLREVNGDCSKDSVHERIMGLLNPSRAGARKAG
ncbi:MAG: adenylate kinase [Rhodothermales bacterium]|nr:adenylate kinase [Rhodothermales bacterium]MBO6779876.1 adenylate kinase [Rhodothermales bacterium]